ncbi:MAG: tRNA pseudouridine(13) synthase TruD [Nannocystis sp.]|nr:tRNA pseudouridine(13) synthase TruD [Nannocystis sp.]
MIDTDTDADAEQIDTDLDPQADAPEPALHASRDAGSLGVTEAELRLLRDPPRQTADLPGVGGRIRARLEDFLVREIPAYPPDGREGAHLLLLLKKRGIGSEDALQVVAERCQIPRAELGLAGLKDTHAVTEQWISAPAAYRAALAAFEHPAIELGPAHPHGNKLRRGHLHGNVFELVLRDLAVPQPLALTRLAAKVSALHERGGLDNLYGEQRLGDGGRNLIRGLALLLGGGARGRRKADFLLSAGQSALFNLYLLERRARGLMRVVLRGDIMRKRATGGLFQSDDPALDQARFDAGELELTGPIFGSKMMAPAPGTPADALERAILDRVGLGPDQLRALGRKLPGTRRPLQLALTDLEIGPASAVELASTGSASHNPGHSAGVSLRFSLPAGAYATALLHELTGPLEPSTASTEAP